MRICVLYNEPSPTADAADRDVLIQVAEVSGALSRLGHDVSSVGCTLDLEQARQSLIQLAPERVFNLVESLAEIDRLMPVATLLLDAMSIPYTGCSTAGLLATNNKLEAKRKLRALGIATPDWLLADGSQPKPGSETRWIVKALWEHASLGMDDQSVVDSVTVAESELRRRTQLMERPHFAEAFVAGREFNLSLLATDIANEPEVLPVAEIDFSRLDPGKPQIVGRAAKWDEASAEFQQTPRKFVTDESDRLLTEQLSDIARRCWKQFGLNGYARVDFRVDATGRPWVLEINANPCLSPDAGFVAALEEAGISFDHATQRILNDCVLPSDEAVSNVVQISHTNEQPPMRIAERPGRARPHALRHQVLDRDRDIVRRIVTPTGMFTDAEVEVAVELVDAAIKQGPAAGYFFVFAEDPLGNVVGYGCYGPIACTTKSFDLYWIAVSPSEQGRGLGKQLLVEVERLVRLAGGERLYIETSGRDGYRSTREFYQRCGFACEATLRDFYAPGDDRATYVKVLK